MKAIFPTPSQNIWTQMYMRVYVYIRIYNFINSTFVFYTTFQVTGQALLVDKNLRLLHQQISK